MHKIIRCLIVITISLFICILSSCKKGDKMFKFEATLNESSVQINKPFSITQDLPSYLNAKLCSRKCLQKWVKAVI